MPNVSGSSPAATETSIETLAATLRDAFGDEIDEPAAYVPQTTFRPYAQVGVLAFRDLILDTFAGTGCLGINRRAEVPGRSEHKEGRAWDWQVCRQCQGDLASEMLDWLLAPDDQGRPFAAARRFGIMYMIWDSRIWGSYAAEQGWRPYSGPNRHTDHVHFSFSWRGALGMSSWWRRANLLRLYDDGVPA